VEVKTSQTVILGVKMDAAASCYIHFTSGKTPQYPSDGRLEVFLIFTNYLYVVCL